MKKTMLFLSMLLVISFAKAQDSYQNDEIKTVFSKNRSNGGYGAFTLAYSNIGGYDSFVSGGRGAFIFDHSFAIGLGGYGFVNNLNYDHYYPGDGSRSKSLAGGYGGLLLEPIIAGRSPVHVSFPILIGMGGVSNIDMYNWEDWHYPDHGYNYEYDTYFVLEPGVELEFNLARFFRLAAAVSYRHTSKIKLLNIDENALKGFNFGLTFKFGKF